MANYWRHGDAGDRIPIQDREVWSCGPHVMAVGDIEQGDAERFLTFVESELSIQPACLYSDPPWDAGAAKSFRTKAGKDRGKVDFGAFFNRVLAIGDQVEGLCWWEIGSKHIGDLHMWIGERGNRVHGCWKITYYGNKPCWLVVESRGPSSVFFGERDFDGLDDAYTPSKAIQVSAREGDAVFDPCMGLGQTAVAAADCGRVAMGLELHPRRTARTLERLAKMGCGDPRKIGELDHGEGT